MFIKPIETRAFGRRFRSRLEARWAVFFTSLRVPWEYEDEGYDLPSGRYLPDFVVGNRRVFFEVKPRDNGDGYQLAAELFEATRRPCFLLIGTPGVCDGTTHQPPDCGCSQFGVPDPLWYDEGGEFRLVPAPSFLTGRRGPSLFLTGDVSDFVWDAPLWAIHVDEGEHQHDRPPVQFSTELRAAAVAARSARFEHGECP